MSGAATRCGVAFDPPLFKGHPVKNLFVLSLGLVVAMAVGGVATAEEAVKSGPQEGDSLGAFYVTKIAGAEDDGVDLEENLCYRCRNGRRPQVIIFTRSTDQKVAELVSKLDKAVAENASSKLCVFVNVLGEDKQDLEKQAKQLAAKTQAKNVPFVVPNEFENGPDNYGINAKAAVTVTMASDLGVKATHAFSKSDELNVDGVLSDLKKILN
jgi:hypothetical protein